VVKSVSLGCREPAVRARTLIEPGSSQCLVPCLIASIIWRGVFIFERAVISWVNAESRFVAAEG
jgi:hypothetical protein